MQALIPVFAILGAAASAQLTLLPYAYLADPLPVYQQSQDTRIGVHAYSYAGGPSAKEEIRGLDGVTRGSYSYVDAHGILQSVFYVADEGGFRVAATNLPTDGDLPLESGQVLLAKNAHLEEHAKAAKEAEEQRTSRRRRSVLAEAENASSPQDQADPQAAKVSPKSSHELPAPEKKDDERDRSDRKAAESIVAPVYGLLDSVLIPRLSGAATSHHSRIDIHNNIRLKAIQPVGAIGILSEPAYEAILPSQVSVTTSNLKQVYVPGKLDEEKPQNPQAIAVQSIHTPAVNSAVRYQLEALPLVSALPDYNENRIQLHKNLGLEGPNRKDTVKIDTAPVTIVHNPIAAVPAIPVVAAKEALPVVAAKEAPLPVVTAVSSQSRTQIHRNAKLEVAVPIVSEPTVYAATSYVQPIANWPILVPVAQSSQYRNQIHSSEKIEQAE